MINLRRFLIEKPSGQVLLATLFFCFIFMVLFAGLYKAGFSYIQKEKAIRSADLTALSVGAVYANGLQLVRWTNTALMVAAIADIVTIAATEGTFDPDFRKVVQTVQRWAFGINKEGDGPQLGLYPLLMWAEGAELASNNHLGNNWPLPPHKLQMPLLPLPMFFFNPETSDFSWLLIPNMRLRFRSAADLLPDFEQKKVEDERVYYRHKDSSQPDGYAYYPPSQVEPAPNSQNPGQMRVKGKAGKFLDMEPVVTPGTGNKDKGTLGGALSTALDLLKKIPLDVTHADDPHNHTVIVYDQLPTSLRKTNTNNTLNYHAVSEIKLVGGGLAAWDLTGGGYFRVRLIAIDLSQFPKIRDFVSSIPGISSMPSVPRVEEILSRVLRQTSVLGFPSASGPFSGTPASGASAPPGSSPFPNIPGVGLPGVPQLPSLPSVPSIPNLSLPDVSQIPSDTRIPFATGLSGIPPLSDIAYFFGINPSNLPEVPEGI